MSKENILNFPTQRVTHRSANDEYASEVVLLLEPEDVSYGYMRSLIRTACGTGYGYETN